MDYPQTDAVHVIPQANLDAEPPSKRTRNSGTPLTDTSSSDTTTASAPSSLTARARAIGKMFFKTKLCSKFRAGTCPYVTNCNFAHSMEEIRRPPPNWQEIVAVHEEERESRQGGNGNSGRNSVEPGNNSNASGGEVREFIREEFQIPCAGNYGGDVGSTGGSSGNRVYKGRHCKKFYTEEGCPYGDTCSFLHDEQSKNRESVAISLGPGGYSGGGGGGGSGGGGGGVGGGSVSGGGVSGSGTVAAGASGVKPSNWKTRICNKWELTGYCPFGSKCHFAHGSAELHRYGGGLVENEARDPSSAPPPDQKQTGAPLKSTADSTATSIPLVPHPDVYNAGVLPQRPMLVIHRTGQRIHHKWKGPNKISRIYGDWIDEAE